MPSRPTAAEPTWFEDFFDEVYLDVFEPELDHGRTVREVDAALALSGVTAPARVLDLACGQGRHAVRLAGMGFDVTGLDLSQELLERAGEHARAAGVHVRWLAQDMREPAGEGRFDLVVNLFNAFGYLPSDEDDLAALRAAATALVPGGLLVQELANREAEVRSERVADVHSIGELTLVEHRALDLRSSRVTVEYTYVHDDQVVRRRQHAQRLYTLTELERLHEAAGLQLREVRGPLADGAGDLDIDDPFVTLLSRRADG